MFFEKRLIFAAQDGGQTTPNLPQGQSPEAKPSDVQPAPEGLKKKPDAMVGLPAVPDNVDANFISGAKATALKMADKRFQAAISNLNNLDLNKLTA